jgi:hypothetical protein
MSNRKKPTRPSPLRAALAAKTTLVTHFDLPIASSDDVERAVRLVNMAEQIVAATLLHEDDAVRQRAADALEKAQAARSSCFHRIQFRHLPIEDFDALVKLHPPTAEHAKDGWIWNPDTFNYALLEEATIDGDLTAAEWEAELSDRERWTPADKRALVERALAAQRQTMADAVPKG